jgi:glycosyltransferase involved in cell wall biosynthesis
MESHPAVMKICIVTDSWQQINGVSTTLKNTVNCLITMGHEVLVIEPSVFKTCKFKFYPDIDFSWNIWKVGKLIQDFQPNAIHIATEGPLGIAARWYCKVNKRQIPHNTSYHTNFPEYLKLSYGIPLTVSYKVLKLFHKFSCRVLVTNNDMKTQLDQRGLKNLVVWSRGVDLSLFAPDRRSQQVQTNLGPGPRILCVSRASKEKNLDAFCQLSVPGTKILVGDGPELARLQTQYPDVKYLGWKTGADLAEIYANADVFVFPSVTDTFGVVMLESISTGTPVVAYNAIGPREVIEQGINGIISQDLAQAIPQALLLDRLTVRQSSLKWTWNKCTEVFLENLVAIKT